MLFLLCILLVGLVSCGYTIVRGKEQDKLFAGWFLVIFVFMTLVCLGFCLWGEAVAPIGKTDKGSFLFPPDRAIEIVQGKDVVVIKDDNSIEGWRTGPKIIGGRWYRHYVPSGQLEIVDRSESYVLVHPNGGEAKSFPRRGDKNGKYWKWNPQKGIETGQCSN